MTTTAFTCYVITTGIHGFDLEVDIIIYPGANALKRAEEHAADLRKMGCEKVRVRPFANVEAAEAYEDKVRGY